MTLNRDGCVCSRRMRRGFGGRAPVTLRLIVNASVDTGHRRAGLWWRQARPPWDVSQGRGGRRGPGPTDAAPLYHCRHLFRSYRSDQRDGAIAMANDGGRGWWRLSWHVSMTALGWAVPLAGRAGANPVGPRRGHHHHHFSQEASGGGGGRWWCGAVGHVPASPGSPLPLPRTLISQTQRVGPPLLLTLSPSGSPPRCLCRAVPPVSLGRAQFPRAHLSFSPSYAHSRHFRRALWRRGGKWVQVREGSPSTCRHGRCASLPQRRVCRRGQARA